MMCEHCGRNEANFYYKSNINGKVKEVHLCSHCAKELGYDKNINFSLGGWMDDVFDMFSPTPLFSRPHSFFDGDWPGMRRMSSGREEAQAAPEAKSAVLLSENEERELARTREVNALREELRQAVESENFERAIELRDKLRGYDQAV